MIINRDCFVRDIVGWMAHDAHALDEKMRKLGPAEVRNTVRREGAVSLYNRRMRDVLNKPFCSYRPRICGNCHEFSGCQTSKWPLTCADAPGNPACWHPEVSHFWIDLERLNVMHGMVLGDFSDVSIRDIATLRALMRTSDMQDTKFLHPFLAEIIQWWWGSRANQEEIKEQQGVIVRTTTGLINRTAFRTEELLGKTSVPSSQLRKVKKEILPELYDRVSKLYPEAFDNLFILNDSL